MRYLSVCSGIEAATVAWHPLGWEPMAFAEIEPFPCRVLAHHYPNVPNLGDLTRYHEWPDPGTGFRPDLVVGGTPCQAFSVAGLRKGLADPRGNLTLVFLGLLARYRPRWVVWENVPGVLSDRTEAFGSLLGGLGKLGYGFAYRVLDAQYFGVAQRRRRVFVVGYLGDWRRAAAVLFEPESLRGDPPPRRGEGKDVAGTLGTSFAGRGYDDRGDTGGASLIPLCMATGPAGAEIGVGVGTTLNCNHEAPIAIQGAATRENPRSGPDGVGVRTNGCAYTLEARQECQAVAFKPSHYTRGKDGAPSDLYPPLSADADKGDQEAVIARHMTVRRLTPRECERLQGFPDDYTLIPGETGRRRKGRDLEETLGYLLAAGFSPDQAQDLAHGPDGPRYRALGNSMAVPKMNWIGARIAAVDALSPPPQPRHP